MLRTPKPRRDRVDYEPTEQENATKCVNDALQFFKEQCLDDSDFVEDEYIFQVMHLPKNDNEADRMVRQFQEDASRWGNYEYDEETEEEDDYVPINKLGVGLSNRTRSSLAFEEKIQAQRSYQPLGGTLYVNN